MADYTTPLAVGAAISPIPDLNWPAGLLVAFGASSVQSAAISARAVVVSCDQNCWIALGSNPVAAVGGVGSLFIPAGARASIQLLTIQPGWKVAVIQTAAGAGNLSIVPCVYPDAPPLPLDLAPGAAGAWSLRRVSSTYTGMAANIRRSSDNAAQDIGFVLNDFDVAGFSAFVGAGNGYVTKWYDQSGNGNHAVQATAANQPQVITGVAALNGRAALEWGAGDGVFVLSAPSTASLDGAFASGGFISLVCQVGSVAPHVDYFANKTGWFITLAGTANTLQFFQGATGNGNWNVLMTPGAHQFDFAYAATALSNMPIAYKDGAQFTINGFNLPTGSFTSDAGQPLIIGNNVLAGGRGFAGRLAEMLLYKGTAVPFGSGGIIRANQRAYWGTP